MSEEERGFLSRLFGEKVLVAESGTGAFSEASGRVLHYSPKEIKDYFDVYYDYDLIRMYVDDLAEAAAGLGFYTTTDEEYPELENGDPDPKDPKPLADSFNKKFNLDDLLPNITKISLIAGFCPVESKIVKDVEKCSLRIIHPLTINPAKNKGVVVKDGKVVAIHQKVSNKLNVVKNPGWNSGESSYTSIAMFTYGQVGNNPLGTSYVRGMIHLLNTLNQATADVEKILRRYLAPLGVWKTRDKIAALKAAVMKRNAGEDIFLGELRPEDVLNPNFPQFFSIDPRVPFWEYIEYLDRRIYAYSRANNIWYLRNATEASAKVIREIVDRHVHSIQRSDKRGIEIEWYTPLMKLNKFAEVPKINFGEETTGIEDIDISEFLVDGLKLAYITENQYYSILKQAGLNLPDPEDRPEEAEPETDKMTEARLPVTTKQYNVIYDVMVLMRFHSQDNTLSAANVKDITEKYCRRYKVTDTELLTTRILAMLELEGYTIVG